MLEEVCHDAQSFRKKKTFAVTTRAGKIIPNYNKNDLDILICTVASIFILKRETVLSLTSDMVKKTVSVLAHSFLLP